MQAVDESALPPATEASRAFREAMEQWAEPAADAAVAALARSAGANEVFELFYQYGCRDFRSIGHKAIYVANARRTLACIGWQHAEPILRSLAYALLNHEGEPNPGQTDLEPDAIGRRNQQRLAGIRDRWLEGRRDDAATAELLDVLRGSTADEACDRVVDLLNGGIGPQSIWDAVLTSAGELLMRQPGIVALHAVTSSNALHYAFTASGRDATRRMLLLQNVAFLRLFHQAMQGAGNMGDDRGDALEPVEVASDGDRALGEIFSDISANPKAAARQGAWFPPSLVSGSTGQRSAPAGLSQGERRTRLQIQFRRTGGPLRPEPRLHDRYLAMSVFKFADLLSRTIPWWNAYAERSTVDAGTARGTASEGLLKLLTVRNNHISSAA